MSILEYAEPTDNETDVIDGAVIGKLIGFASDGRVPLVTYSGRGTMTGLPAESTIDLHGFHIGQKVVLMFERGNPRQPIVLGVLRTEGQWPLAEKPGHIELQMDGERLMVTANAQLVLRCGAASITLTKAGKILINGEYVSSRSKGVNRITGGSVQLN